MRLGFFCFTDFLSAIKRQRFCKRIFEGGLTDPFDQDETVIRPTAESKVIKIGDGYFVTNCVGEGVEPMTLTQWNKKVDPASTYDRMVATAVRKHAGALPIAA